MKEKKNNISKRFYKVALLIVCISFFSFLFYFHIKEGADFNSNKVKQAQTNVEKAQMNLQHLKSIHAKQAKIKDAQTNLKKAKQKLKNMTVTLPSITTPILPPINSPITTPSIIKPILPPINSPSFESVALCRSYMIISGGLNKKPGDTFTIQVYIYSPTLPIIGVLILLNHSSDIILKIGSGSGCSFDDVPNLPSVFLKLPDGKEYKGKVLLGTLDAQVVNTPKSNVASITANLASVGCDHGFTLCYQSSSRTSCSNQNDGGGKYFSGSTDDVYFYYEGEGKEGYPFANISIG